MPTTNTTPNRGYELPADGNDLRFDIDRLLSAFGDIDSDVAALIVALALKASLESPALTGTPTAPTATLGDDSSKIASTAFVQNAIDALLDAAPGALNTLNELAAALGDDPDFATTVTNALAGKLSKNSNLSDLQDVSVARTNLGIHATVQALLGSTTLAALRTGMGLGYASDAEKTSFRTHSTSGLRTITGADSITPADWGKTILLNSASAATVTFSAVATLGDGFWCKFKNIGAGAITLDPNSSETIDGQATSIVPTNDFGDIICTGSVLHTVGRPPLLSLTSATVSSGPVAIPLAAYLLAGFSKYKLYIRRARPNTDGAYMVLDVSVTAGSSYVNSGYHTPGAAFNAAGVSGQLTTDQTTFVIADNTGNVSGEETYTAVDFEITAADFIMRASGENRTTAGDNRGFTYNGHQPTGNVNQIRFNFNTGGIAAASYELVGYRG